MFDAIDSRTLNGLPLSIGTSLALESIFDPVRMVIDETRVPPPRVILENYNEVWFNVGTLFRNMYNSIDKAGIGKVTSKEFADCLSAEMDTIADLVNPSGEDKVKALFYYCTYNDLTTRFMFGKLRLPTTSKQQDYAMAFNGARVELLKRSLLGKVRDIKQYNSVFSGGAQSKVLIVTHYPVDLLNVKNFKTLDLLESHTGVLKKRTDWYTKYYDGRGLNMLPFNGILLTVFGDDHHFSPQKKNMKEALLDLAKEKRWNCLTTNGKVVEDIKTLRDHPLRIALLKQEH